MGWKITSALAGIAAGFAARQIIRKSWQKTTGKAAPDSAEDPALTWGEAIAFAAISGVIMEVVRTVATRGAAEYYAKRTGLGPLGDEA